jgi:hypothetical protein
MPNTLLVLRSSPPVAVPKRPRLETNEGFEQTVCVCHVAHFLLVKKLLPKSVFCATWNDRSEIGSNYFSHCRKTKPSAETANHQVAARLWELSERWLKEKGFCG